MPASPSTVIDIHPHIISPDLKRYPRAPLGGKQSDWSATRPVSLEQLIAAMDGSGVKKAAIVQASTCYGHDNSYVADAVAAHPKRFTGVFSVDVLAPDATVRMRHWMERGLTGMRLFTFGSTMSEQAVMARRCEILSGLDLCGRSRSIDLHADVGFRDSATRQDDRTISESENHSRSYGAAGAR